jgi:hypothetical protein
VSYGGIGGGVIGYKYFLKLHLAGNAQEYDVPCAFAPLDLAEGLLGQTGFFDNYKVVFEKYKNQFEVIARTKPQAGKRKT